MLKHHLVRTDFQFRDKVSESVQRPSRPDDATFRPLWHRIADGCCGARAFYGGCHRVKLTGHRHLPPVVVSCTLIASFTAEAYPGNLLYEIASPEPAE
jgi:hypothetical protein